MKTQFDNDIRVVSLENLRAMCERIGGIAHKTQISKVTTNRVYVTTDSPSSETETWGHQVTAIFPCWPSTWDGKENPSIALDILRIIGETEEDYDASQYFTELLDCPPLFRSIPADTECIHCGRVIGEHEAFSKCPQSAPSVKVTSYEGPAKWETEYEIVSAKYGYSLESRWFQGCYQFYRVTWQGTAPHSTAYPAVPSGLSADVANTAWETAFPGDPTPLTNTDQAPGEYRDWRDAQAAVVAHCKRLEGRS